MILMYSGMVRKNVNAAPYVSTAAFTVGYLTAWTLFSLIATVLQWQLDRLLLLSPMMVSKSPYLGAGILVAAGSVVCIMPQSGWASVPLGGLGLNLGYGPFDFPFLDLEALARYPVPTTTEVAAACDVVVFNDFHLGNYEAYFVRVGLGDLWQQWLSLFDDMATRYSRQRSRVSSGNQEPVCTLAFSPARTSSQLIFLLPP